MFSIQISQGRLTKDPVLYRKRNDDREIVWTRYTLAVDRDRKVEGKPNVDFFSCLVFGRRAEFAEKHFKKGQTILVIGRPTQDEYIDSEGNHIRMQTLMVWDQRFAGSKKGAGQISEKYTVLSQNPTCGNVADEKMPSDMSDIMNDMPDVFTNEETDYYPNYYEDLYLKQ